MGGTEPLRPRMVGWVAKPLLLTLGVFEIAWISHQHMRYFSNDPREMAYPIFGVLTLLTAICMLFGRLRWFVTTMCIFGTLRAIFWILTANGFDLNKVVYIRGLSVELKHYYFYSLFTFPLALFYTLLPREQPEVAAPAPTKRFALTEQNWHEWLLASLRAAGVRRLRLDPYWHVVAPVITMFCLTAFMLALNAIIDRMGSGRSLPDRQVAFYLRLASIPFAIFIVSRIYNRCLRLAWQSRARGAERELMRNTSRRPVLYLRSFALDAQLGRPSWMERFLGTIPLATAEQAIVKVLRKYGPVIAIGRPGEALPPLGAARFYVSDELWKSKVEDTARVAQLVVWATGLSEGLHWELDFLIKNVPPEKLVIWAHPHLLRLSEARREKEWRAFRASLGRLFPKPLPERLGAVRFFYFKADHEPVGVASTWVFGANARALRAALDVIGLKK
jgi:hypothetical protein